MLKKAEAKEKKLLKENKILYIKQNKLNEKLKALQSRRNDEVKRILELLTRHDPEEDDDKTNNLLAQHKIGYIEKVSVLNTLLLLRSSTLSSIRQIERAIIHLVDKNKIFDEIKSINEQLNKIQERGIEIENMLYCNDNYDELDIDDENEDDDD